MRRLKSHAYVHTPKGEGPFPLSCNASWRPFCQENIHMIQWPQFFANNGYMVCQPQYRGSYGYGIEFHKKSFIRWWSGWIINAR